MTLTDALAIIPSMRTFLLVSGAILLFGCSTDTFVGSDGGADSGAGDVVIDTPQVTNDGAADADITPLNPNNLGNDLVLWLRADDANFDNGTSLVSQWQDQSPHQQAITLKTGSPGSCSPLGVSMHENEVNSLPAVSFCGAVIEAADDASLQWGTDGAFLIAAVVQLGSPLTPDNYFFATKTTSSTAASGFALWAPNALGGVEAYLKATDLPHLTASVSGAGQYHVMTLARRKALAKSTLTFRIDGVSTPLTVNPEDVSELGAPLVIGGFDNGSGGILHVIPGKLAEILVVANATGLPDLLPASMDLYLEQKYKL